MSGFGLNVSSGASVHVDLIPSREILRMGSTHFKRIPAVKTIQWILSTSRSLGAGILDPVSPGPPKTWTIP